MIRKQHNPVALIPCAILGVSLLAGCATKGYVNKNIEEVRQEHRTDVEGIKTEVAALSNSTQDALARAKTAMGDADEARELALGKAGLEELNRYTVYFGFNQDEIKDTETGTLQGAASEIGQHPEAIIDVYGFADPTGPDGYNLELGQRRAMEVVRYLTASSPNQLSRYAAVSFGERDLAGMSADSGEHARQRRVVVSLIRRVPLGQSEAPSAEFVPGD